MNKKVWDKKEYKPLKKLSLLYLKRHPRGKYQEGVRFQMGVVAYNRKDFVESESHLLSLAKTGNDKKITVHAQDLILDILNFRKDFETLVVLSKSFMGNMVIDKKRKDFLNKIYLESSFSLIVRLSEKKDLKKKELAAEQFRTYWRDNKKFKLAKEALWRSASIYMEVGNLYQGGLLSINYVTFYPKDEKNGKLLNVATDAFEKIGQLRFAAETLLRLSNLYKTGIAKRDVKKEFKWREIAGDYYNLIDERQKAYDLYWELQQKTKDSGIRSRLLFKIAQMYKENEKHSHHQGAVSLLVRLKSSTLCRRLLFARGRKTLYLRQNEGSS